MNPPFDFDAIVVGAGHAGTEAAHALAALGKKTLVVCLNKNAMGNLPCNPSIGGSTKGIVVREIDALGGIEGKLADATTLQMKVLNLSKGPGVRSLRAQVDKIDYPKAVLSLMEKIPNLTIEEGMVVDLCVGRNGSIEGVALEGGRTIRAKAVVLTTGTHMESTILRGHEVKEGGPDGERPSHGLSKALFALGIKLLRLKTGTPPRIRRGSIDFSLLEPQPGTPGRWAFSYDADSFLPVEEQMLCHLTYTTPTTHRIIRDHLEESAMYGGLVKGVGPRYCPSIEDKVVRFFQHERHMLFVEPESKHNDSVYLQGFSTSMPPDLQEAMVRSLPGFSRAEFLKYAYAIEYDAIQPLQVDHSLMVRGRPGLFIAGQILGTSGYEEAAGAGLLAGINASLFLDGKPPFVLRRDQAYLGVMVDDLVTKGTKEPYRLLSSRSEYRLLTRSDNADERLMKIGYDLGLNSKERYDRFRKRMDELKKAEEKIASVRVGSNAQTAVYLRSLGEDAPESSSSYREILKRPKVTYEGLQKADPRLEKLSSALASKLETNVKYEGYIELQKKEVEKVKAMEGLKLPPEVDYGKVEGLSLEAREKLSKVKPATIGEASRIASVHPADIDRLLFLIRRKGL